MKRYLLFVYPKFYPSGGWHDYQGQFDSVDDAETHCQTMPHYTESWLYHVTDTETGKVVAGDEDGA